jgi:FKBP-type peptidyl-prolyl cis-trans isomerase (trigger factor)
MSKQDTPYTITRTDLPGSTIEIKGEITWEHLATFEEPAFTKLAEKIQLDGFRKGNVPKDVAKKHIPDELLLADMAELAINDVYPTILAEETIDAIGRPEVALTKLARGNAMGFTITTAVVPTIKLPDYQKIGKSIALTDAKEITEEDIDKVVQDLRQIRAYGHVHTEHDEHVHEEPLPEVDDAFAQSFGEFKTVADMREKVKENLIKEATQAVFDKRRVTIMEDIIKETTFEIPAIILDSEKQKMLATIEADIARSGASLDDYLTHIKKTKEELLADFTPEAEKRARFQLVLNAIARDAKLFPTEEEVEAEAQKYMAMYPTADLNRTKAYADMVLTNEKVLAMLEGK